MIFRVITEGENDAFLNRLLSVKTPANSFRVISPGGYSSAISLARSFLATKPDRLAVVVDADSTDPESVDLRRRRATEALGEVATEDRYYLTLAVPEIEAWYFPSPSAASRVLGRSISEVEWNEIKRHPKDVVAQALGGASARFDAQHVAAFLDRVDLDTVAELPDVKSLLEFMQLPYAAAW